VRRFALMLNKIVIVLLLVAVSSFSQVAAPVGTSQPAGASQTQPMPYGLSQALAQLEQVAPATVRDINQVRVDKWKTDGKYKDQSRGNAQSLQRNLNAALPGLIQQVKANPANIAPALKLYRNVNALYDVLASFTESAGAFGSKDDYNALANDVSNLDAVRRSLADQLEQMASSQDAQVARLSSQLQASRQAATTAATPPKRIVVDDTKPAAKKTSTKKKPAASTPTPKSE
jgi:hypothetical protein